MGSYNSLGFSLDQCLLNQWHTMPPFRFWCPLARASFAMPPACSLRLQPSDRSYSLTSRKLSVKTLCHLAVSIVVLIGCYWEGSLVIVVERALDLDSKDMGLVTRCLSLPLGTTLPAHLRSVPCLTTWAVVVSDELMYMNVPVTGS